MNTSSFVLTGVLALVAAPVAATWANGATADAEPAVKHGKATGVIKAIDSRAGTLTIRHGPIAGVGWPAMTMTFTAKPASLLKGLKVGQAIDFDATVRGMSAEVTAVRPK